MAALLVNIAQIVAHTPLWVWGLYALLLFLGFQRTRDASVALWRLLTLPLIVTALVISSLVFAGPGTLSAFVCGVMIGGAGGWQLEPIGATRRLPDGRVWLRGEWSSFALLVMVLLFRYATSVASAMDPTLRASATWQWSTVFVAVALSALFLGRTAARLRAYTSADAAPAVPMAKSVQSPV